MLNLRGIKRLACAFISVTIVNQIKFNFAEEGIFLPRELLHDTHTVPGCDLLSLCAFLLVIFRQRHSLHLRCQPAEKSVQIGI